jgi:hypothetical protein
MHHPLAFWEWSGDVYFGIFNGWLFTWLYYNSKHLIK